MPRVLAGVSFPVLTLSGSWPGQTDLTVETDSISTSNKKAPRGASVGACRSARRVHEWHQGLGGGHAQAQRQGFMVHGCQKPLQRVACLRQPI